MTSPDDPGRRHGPDTRPDRPSIRDALRRRHVARLGGPTDADAPPPSTFGSSPAARAARWYDRHGGHPRLWGDDRSRP